MAISTHGLTKLYGAQKALDGVTLELPKGQIVGLLGPNGAGKSTLMKILTGYLPASEGTASVCGLDCATESIEVRKRVGYLPEHNPLYQDMYVTEFLRFVANLYGAPEEAVEQRIAEVGLTPERHKQIKQLSKGYRQRVGLAAALVHDPEVLILDEPTTGLDPNQLVEIRKLIRNVGANKTVLLSTHIMQEVEALCDRVVFIRKGKIVREDSIETFTKKGGENLEATFRKVTS
jgi:ABC-2 type transport system ATP-binding protein